VRRRKGGKKGGREEGRYDGKAYAPLEEDGDGVEHGGLHLQQSRGEGGQVFHHRHLEDRDGGREGVGVSKT